jgi:transcriptional regulator with XRE-family HTH domain
MAKEITKGTLGKLISNKLNFLRKSSGQTNEATADSLDLDLSEFYKLLRGKRIPHLMTLLRINQKYGVTMDWWFSELEETSRDKLHIRSKALELQILNTIRKLDIRFQEIAFDIVKTLRKRTS